METVPLETHGKERGYKKFKCRCDACREWKRSSRGKLPVRDYICVDCFAPLVKPSRILRGAPPVRCESCRGVERKEHLATSHESPERELARLIRAQARDLGTRHVGSWRIDYLDSVESYSSKHDYYTDSTLIVREWYDE